MEALIASYGDASSDSGSDSEPVSPSPSNSNPQRLNPLPPPPLDLLNPPNSLGKLNYLQSGQASRVRSFPHVEGNYALHVYIPVSVPPAPRKALAQFLKRVSSLVPDLNAIDADIPLNVLCTDDLKLEQIALGREFHISLGRTVPILVHQIDSLVAMLRQKLQSWKRYWIDFNKWEVFMNDDFTRFFLSIEVIKEGLAEVSDNVLLHHIIFVLTHFPEKGVHIDY